MSPEETSLPSTPGERSLDILVAIDTDAVLRLPDGAGDFDHPTPVEDLHGCPLVTATGGGESRADGSVAVRAGAAVRIFLTSGSNNFEQLAALADVRYVGDDEVLQDFARQTAERLTVAPASSTEVLPARLHRHQFWFSQGVAAGAGTGRFDLVFALYDRDDRDQPYLIGYYRWAMQLTVTLEEE